MGRSFVTAADVAARAGVSRSAVSRTFTAGAYVSAGVRARVNDAAQQVGYRVNRLAQSLICEQSSLVGLVAAQVEAPFNAALVATLSQILPASGLQCLLFNAARDVSGIVQVIERILEFRARAIVILSGTPPNAIVEESLRRGLKVILVNRPMRGVAAQSIMSDDVGGVRLAVDRLVGSGARRLAVVASGTGTPSQRRRMAIFCRRVNEHGLTPLKWAAGETGYEAGVQAADALLKRDRPDGIFCTTDLIALGLLDAARQTYRIQVPEELSIIGFDDIAQASWAPYRLTTIRQSVPALGQAVLEALQHDESPARRVFVPVELIERSTVRCQTSKMEDIHDTSIKTVDRSILRAGRHRRR